MLTTVIVKITAKAVNPNKIFAFGPLEKLLFKCSLNFSTIYFPPLARASFELYIKSALIVKFHTLATNEHT